MFYKMNKEFLLLWNQQIVDRYSIRFISHTLIYKRQLMHKRLNQDRWFTEEECQIIMHNLLKSLAYIHSKNIVHRDLKPENILIHDIDDLSSLKISDFGLSVEFCQESRQTTLQKQCGTLIYMAPELLDNKVYGKSVDIWSVGVIMYRLLNRGEHPYYNINDQQDVLRQKMEQIQLKSNNLTDKQQSLFCRLTMMEGSHRYTAHQCLQHPWLTNEKDAEIPQTMEEIFIGWRLGQKLALYMKVFFALQALGWKINMKSKGNNYLEKCNLVSFDVQSKLNSRNGKPKEFYDQLFNEYEQEFSQLKDNYDQKNPKVNNQNNKQRSAWVEKNILLLNTTSNSKRTSLNKQDLTSITIQQQSDENLINQPQIQQLTDDYDLSYNALSVPKRKQKLNKTCKFPSPIREKKKELPKQQSKNNSPYQGVKYVQQQQSLKNEIIPNSLKLQLKEPAKLIQQPSILPIINNKQEKISNFNFTQGQLQQSYRGQKRNNINLYEQKQVQIIFFIISIYQIYVNRYYKNMIGDRTQVQPNVLDLAGGFGRDFSQDGPNNHFTLALYNYPLIGSNDSNRLNRATKFSQSVRRESVNPSDIVTERIQKLIRQFVQRKQ